MSIVDKRLWCMHVSGMDEVHPAPNRATAQRWVAQFTVDHHRRNPSPHPYDPVMNFSVQEWPHAADRHAEGLAASVAANTWPVDPLTVDEQLVRNALRNAESALSTLSADAIRQGEGSTTANSSVVGTDRWRHVKRGTVYEVIGTAELQAGQPQLEHAELVIYRGEDGKLWARNSAEFHDGRFVPASHASDGGKA